jgi:hypothetical protein
MLPVLTVACADKGVGILENVSKSRARTSGSVLAAAMT